jgi:electron transport complex protein RnfE
LTLLGGAREILGTGAIFGCNLYAEDFGMLMFVLAPGAFLVLGYLIALVNKIKK